MTIYKGTDLVAGVPDLTGYATTNDVTTAISATLSSLYPIGSVYIGTQSTCPLATLISGSTWTLVATDRALWGGDGTNADTTIAAGLPNITGNIYRVFSNGQLGDGAFSPTNEGLGDVSAASWDQQTTYNFDASRSSSVYGQSTTVQPPAYRVNVWKRTA